MMKEEKKTYPIRETIRRFIPYYRPYFKTEALDLVCAALTTGCELALPMILKYITNTGLSDAAALTLQVILKMGLLYLGLSLVDLAANYFMCLNGHNMGVYIENDMRTDAYAHLQKLSNTYYSNTKVGQIMGRITNDLFDVTEFAHHCPEEFVIAGIKGIGSFIILIRINVPLTLAIFVLIPVMAVICARINLRFRREQRAQRVQIGELNSRIEDSLLGQKVVKAFTNEDLECEKFAEGNRKYRTIKRNFYKYMALFQTTTRISDRIMNLTAIVLGAYMLFKGRITAGDLVAYIMYVATLITTVRRIAEYAEQFTRGVTGIERFLEIMDADIEIFDEPGAKELQHVTGHIEFRKVSFEYPDDASHRKHESGVRKVLKDLDLDIKPGEKLAIVGPSGAGKTTLCNLIPRFYEVTGGSVLIDGNDIRSYTLKSLRGNIGMVQQDVYLFSGTIMDNILYGRPGASREEAIEAAKKAGAYDFIMELEDGFDTYAGERGVKLSGGQRQKISIARIFLKNPPVIILDEATSALDNTSEFEVAEALKKLAEGRTTITIAHRLSTIKHADRIVVLDRDGIVEEGNHDTLMALKGRYYEFYTISDRLK